MSVHLGDTVHLDGSDSDAPDNGPQPLTFQWRFVSVTPGSHLTNANLRDAQTEKPSFTPDVVGHYVLELAVFDGFARVFDNVMVTVLLPLRCNQAATSTPQLWPPNHQLVAVNIVGVTASHGDPVTIGIVGVTQDEDVLAQGSGNTCPDAFIQGETVQVRAECAGLQTGRVYRIRFQAKDPFGAQCTGEVQVCVPHDQAHGCIESAEVHDATSCPANAKP